MEEHPSLTRLQQGDLSGLQALVERYQVPAVHAAYLIVGDRALAEDIAQGAFVKVAERIQQYDDRRPFAPWFFRIVLNDALKVAQHQNRQVSLEAVDEPTAQLAAWLTDPSLGPEQLVEQRQTHQLLHQAIHSLPPDQRAVIVMRYFLDMSEADMSTKLARPLSTVKWWLRDARKRLASWINVLR